MPVEVTHSQQGRVSSIDPILSQKLGARLLEVTAALPQKRGFEFERFLKDLFDAFGLSARASFRLTGEQMDGSLVMHNEIYLFEAKWQMLRLGPQICTRLKVNSAKKQFGHVGFL